MDIDGSGSKGMICTSCGNDNQGKATLKIDIILIFAKSWYSQKSVVLKRHNYPEKVIIQGCVEGERLKDLGPDEWAKLKIYTVAIWEPLPGMFCLYVFRNQIKGVIKSQK